MRIKSLDSLRGLAAVAVAIFHYTTQYSKIFETNITTRLIDFKYGHYGVQLFFIISGFVIFMTINKINTPAEFLYKRFIRLYPVFWICMIITSCIIFNFPPGFDRTLKDVFVNFTMIPSLLGFKPIDGAYWSLIPELFFYFLMFILLLFKSVNKIIYIGFFWIVLSLLSELNYIPNFITLFLNLKYGLFFLTGINFYYIFEQKDKIINHVQILLCVLVSYFSDEELDSYFFILFIIIFYLLSFNKLNFLNGKFLNYIGKISYSFYLLHQFIGFTIIYNLINYCGIINSYLLIIIPLIISILLAILVSEYFERPFMKWIKNTIGSNYFLKK